MHFLPPLPPEFCEGAFSVAEAAKTGIAPSRLRRGDLHAPYWGIRTTVVPRTGVERAFTYAPNLRDSQAFSHVSAALLWGMWLPARLQNDPTVDVLALAPRDRPVGVGVRGHRAVSEPLAFARGLPVVSAPRTWVQLAPMLSLDELVAAGDSLIRRKDPLVELDELSSAVRPGERGAVRARRASPLLRAGADSPKETEVRLLLGRARLPVPEVNGEIVTRSGLVTHGDLVFRKWRVLAEYDGVQHRATKRQFERDVLRLEALARDEWSVIRILDVHLADPFSVVERVASALRARGWRGRLSRGGYLRDLRCLP